MTVPDGFVPSTRTGPFVEHLGALRARNSPRGVELGMRADEQHLNARGFVHGAVLCALLDMVTGRNAAQTEGHTPMPLVTVSLTVNFLATAALGDWLHASATVRHQGRRLAFADGQIRVDDKLIATSSATFAVSDTRWSSR